MIFPSRAGFQPTPPPAPRGAASRAALAVVRTWAPDAAGQMALDHALARSVWAGQRPPTLRLYGWHAPAVTLGRLQRTGPLPWAAVRRWTGGRAVFHQDEVTVALALPAGHPWIARTVPETYRNVAAPLFSALAALGLAVAAAGGRRAGPDRFGCFASPTPLEGAVAGHKVVALAQRLGPHGLLAQASLPLTPPVAFGPRAARSTAGLRHFRPDLTWEAVAAAVEAAFAAALGADPQPLPPRPAEAARARALARGPYAPRRSAASGPPGAARFP